MLIKPFVWWRSLCRRDFLKVPNAGQLISSPSCVSGAGLLFPAIGLNSSQKVNSQLQNAVVSQVNAN